MDFSDFVQSSTLIVNFADLNTVNMIKHFNLQNMLLKVNSMMTHHDAITGTHSVDAGNDYLDQMKGAHRYALTDYGLL